jgi:hypothetical protein
LVATLEIEERKHFFFEKKKQKTFAPEALLRMLAAANK